jgi:hypothetical protein
MTPVEARRWFDAFAVLSLARFAPLFGDLGLPNAIAAEPVPAIRCARAMLDKDLLVLNSDEAEAHIQEALACIATEYDAETAATVRHWCARFIIDDAYASALFAWEQLIRRLCGLITDDELTVPSPLDAHASEGFCTCVTPLFERTCAQAQMARLEASTREPESSWERHLDDLTRRAAGDPGHSLGAIEMAHTTISMILRNRRTRDALRCLETALSADERQSVFSWARVQGERLSIPPSIIEPEVILARSDT